MRGCWAASLGVSITIGCGELIDCGPPPRTLHITIPGVVDSSTITGFARIGEGVIISCPVPKSPLQFCRSDGVVLMPPSSNPVVVQLMAGSVSFTGTIAVEYDEVDTGNGCSRLEAFYEVAGR